MTNKVVVTGLGAITPIGNNVEEFFESLKAGKCGIDYITRFDASNFKVKIAAEVKGFDPSIELGRKEEKRMDRYCQFAMVAAKEAIKDSGLDLEAIDKERFGVIVSSGIGGIETIEKEHLVMQEKGPDRVSALLIPMIISNMASGNIAIAFGAKGYCTTVVTACASATHSIGDAYRLIKHGYADIMICGGTDASITQLSMAGFTNIKALNTSNNPSRASIPFDKEREGFVMGEGAGIVILESEEHAKKRNARIYAEIAGYGATCDAHHITAPAPFGEGATRAMKMAIDEAGIKPNQLSYINAHGTSTPINDKYESEAIKTLLGDDAKNVAVSSTKSMTGHLLGAAGGIEAVACVKAIQEGFIPPTINYQVPDEDCDLDYVPNKGREQKLDYVLSNSLGFGGHNGTLLFKRID